MQLITCPKWQQIKLNKSPSSLLNSATSAEVVSIIIDSIKHNDHFHFNNILEPLWKNFVAPQLFHKLSLCQKQKDDDFFLEEHLFVNEVIASYLGVFTTGKNLPNYFSKLSRSGSIIVLQRVFFHIVSSEKLLSFKVRRRYFDLWFKNPRIQLLNHAYYDDTNALDANSKNSDIMQLFLCALVCGNQSKNIEGEAEMYLNEALSKDKMAMFQAIKRRSKEPIIYGLYVTVDMLKAVLFKAVKHLDGLRFTHLFQAIWNLCKQFERNDLMNHLPTFT